MARSIPARIGVIVASTVAVAALGIGAIGMLPPPAGQQAAAAEPPAEADHCYIEGMLLHHEQALVLSASVVDDPGVSERVRALADFIVVDQSAEIETMTAWSEAWAEATGSTAAAGGGHDTHGAAPAAPAGAAPACTRDVHAEMAGMATPEQLAALDAADGADAQRLFLELMIAHHEGALVMAEAALAEATNAFVRSSAKHVIVEQTREIEAMTQILAGG